MEKQKLNVIWIVATLAIILAGCTPKTSFEGGLAKINEIDAKHKSTMTSFPMNLEELESMESDINQLKSLKISAGQEAFDMIIKFKLEGIEAEKLFNQSQKYGLKGTIDLGFGCKSRPFIIEAGELKKQSAQKGFESVDFIEGLVSKYPDEAAKAGITQKEKIFRNATFYKLSADGQKAIKTVSKMCTENRTLELYQEDFRKSTNFSEDYINELDYEKAAEIWKEKHG